jgi:predicted transcriptional regulator
MFVKDYMCDWVNSISEEATFPEVVKKMVEEKTNSIVITNQEGKPVGLVSSQSLIKQVVPDYLGDNPTNSMFGAEGTFDKYALKAKKLKVSDFMETDFHSLSIDDAMIEAAAYSLKGKQRFMPVINEKGELAGAITRTCIKNALYNVFFKENQIDPKDNRR